jgi:hypothetical protein
VVLRRVGVVTGNEVCSEAGGIVVGTGLSDTGGDCESAGTETSFSGGVTQPVMTREVIMRMIPISFRTI